MDVWTKVTVAAAPFVSGLRETGERWFLFAISLGWLWLALGLVALGLLAALWISKRVVVRPLSQLIQSRSEAMQNDNRLNMMAGEVKQVRLAVNELRFSLVGLKELEAELKIVRTLADELRSVVSALKKEREESAELRSAVQEIRLLLSSIKREDDEMANELRAGLNSLIRDYELARTD